MNPETTTTIRTYTREMDAQLAVMELEIHNIEAAIEADDCGGARPELRTSTGVRVLVDNTDLQQADKILNALEEKQSQENSTEEDTATSSPSRLLWFLLGAGITAATFLINNYLENHRTTTLSFDTNQDGHSDASQLFVNGSLIEYRQDRNHDGKDDTWFFYTNDLIQRCEADNNFDGCVDWRGTYADNMIISAEEDLDANGIFDLQATYVAEIVQTVEVRPNGSDIVARREEYENGQLKTEWEDTNLDGAFDIKRSFNNMGTRTEEKQITHQ